jgi:hypothetical protein
MAHWLLTVAHWWVSEFLVTERASDPLLLSSKVDGVFMQILHPRAAQRGESSLHRDVEGTLGLERGISETLETFVPPRPLRPQLGRP